MGVVHGAYCLGCCWFLMALLFVGGVMNPIWVVGIAIYVALEKMLPVGQWLSRAAGATLAVLGAFLLTRTI
jgi:predicted metal-binding membrane protein